MLQPRAGTMGRVLVTVKDAAAPPDEQETRRRHGRLYRGPEARRILSLGVVATVRREPTPHVVESRTHRRRAYGLKQ